MTSDKRKQRTYSQRDYLSDYDQIVAPLIDRSLRYNQFAIDFASSGLRGLTYLNGGALVAIPTAVALFNADPSKAGTTLVTAALLFILGLVCVVIAHAASFFTMARRAEMQVLSARIHTNQLQTELPSTSKEDKNSLLAQTDEDKHRIPELQVQSNRWRMLGIWMFWLSLLSFGIGCWFGAQAVLSNASASVSNASQCRAELQPYRDTCPSLSPRSRAASVYLAPLTNMRTGLQTPSGRGEIKNPSAN